MKSSFGEEAEIRAGATGQFDVLVNGKLIFSKKETGRFPDDGEVEERFELLKSGKDLPPILAVSGGAIRKLVGRLFG